MLMTYIYIYIFESGQITHGPREPCEAELECCDLGILTLLRVGTGAGAVIVEALRGDESGGTRIWEPIAPCGYSTEDDPLR